MLLLVILVVLIVLLVIGMLTGFAGILQNTPLIAVRGSGFNTSPGATVITLSHLGGDRVAIDNLSREDSVEVRFLVGTPSNVTYDVGLSPVLAQGSWVKGGSIFIYRDRSGYRVTDDIQQRIEEGRTLGPLVDLQRGTWIISIVDSKTDVLITAVRVIIG